MNDQAKRGRGRPKGSGLDDAAILTKIADMIAAAPALKPTTALKRAELDSHPSTIRRIQVKWKAEGRQYLDRAEAKRAKAISSRGTPTLPRRSLRQLETASQQMRAALGGAATAALYEAMNDPALSAAREAFDSPAMRAMREMHNNPTMKALRELQDSPTMRAMRELQDSPTMRATRELQKFMRMMNGSSF